MRVMNWKTAIPIVLAVVIVLLAAEPGLSAGDGHQLPKAKPKVSWIAIVYLVIALAGICVAGFKKPRRTHLD